MKLTVSSIIQAIHRTKKWDNQIACDLIAALVQNRLLPDLRTSGDVKESDRDRLEKACVTYVLFAVGSAEVVPAAEALQALLHSMSQDAHITLSAKAVHAMQTLIWKASGSDDPLATDAWLQVLRHPAFDAAGQSNKAKIGR